MAAPPKKYEKNIIAFFGPNFCRTSKKKVFLKRSLRAAFIFKVFFQKNRKTNSDFPNFFFAAGFLSSLSSLNFFFFSKKVLKFELIFENNMDKNAGATLQPEISLSLTIVTCHKNIAAGDNVLEFKFQERGHEVDLE